MFVTFITIWRPFYQIMDYRDTRAYILDPCIQEFFWITNVISEKSNISEVDINVKVLGLCENNVQIAIETIIRFFPQPLK